MVIVVVKPVVRENFDSVQHSNNLDRGLAVVIIVEVVVEVVVVVVRKEHPASLPLP